MIDLDINTLLDMQNCHKADLFKRVAERMKEGGCIC